MKYGEMSKLRYLLYIPFHPITGYEELKYNKKGSLMIANLVCALFVLANIINSVVTAFLFRNGKTEDVNVILLIAGVLGGVFIFSCANWLFCTLLNGIGRLKEIWIVLCYAMLPYAVISIPLSAMSHIFTLDEGVFFYAVNILLLIWSGSLAFVGIMAVHEFSIPKNIATVFLSFLGIGIILFLLLLIFSLFQNIYIFAVTIINEILFRL